MGISVLAAIAAAPTIKMAMYLPLVSVTMCARPPFDEYCVVRGVLELDTPAIEDRGIDDPADPYQARTTVVRVVSEFRGMVILLDVGVHGRLLSLASKDRPIAIFLRPMVAEGSLPPNQSYHG